MKQWMFPAAGLAAFDAYVVEGLATLDAHVSPDTALLLREDELILRHAASGLKFSIPTIGRPQPGCKAVARCSLDEVLRSPVVWQQKAGRGPLNAAVWATTEQLARQPRTGLRGQGRSLEASDRASSAPASALRAGAVRRRPAAATARRRAGRLVQWRTGYA
jgi:hypothetical protein